MRRVSGLMFSAVPGPRLNAGETTAALVILAAWLWQLVGERISGPSQILALAGPARKLAYAFVASAALVAAAVYFLGTAAPPTTFIYFRF
jgi:hypothetical protein